MCSHVFENSWTKFVEYSTENDGIVDVAKGCKRALEPWGARDWFPLPPPSNNFRK
jgi:hypothetical protein